MGQEHSLVVGGTRGAGRAIARRFAASGARVSVIGRRPPPDSDLGAGDIRHWPTDLGDATATRAALADLVASRGPLDHLVFCQRFRAEGDAWEGELETTLGSTKRAIEFLSAHFAAAGARAIVLVGSVAGRFIATEQPVGYHAAKAALAHMARYYAVALGPLGIRVNCVAPCTMLKEESAGFYADHPEVKGLYERIVPLGRMGTTEDLADLVEFLCGPRSGFITGQEILLDGGLSLQGHEALARKLDSLDQLPITQPPPPRP